MGRRRQVLGGEANALILHDNASGMGPKVGANVDEIPIVRGAGGTAQNLDHRATQRAPIGRDGQGFNLRRDAPMADARTELGGGYGHGLVKDWRQRVLLLGEETSGDGAGTLLGGSIGQGQQLPGFSLEGKVVGSAQCLGAAQESQPDAVHVPRQEGHAAGPAISQGALRLGLGEASCEAMPQHATSKRGCGCNGKDSEEYRVRDHPRRLSGMR